MLKPGCHEEAKELLKSKRYLDEGEFSCSALTPEDFVVLAEESGLEVVKIIGKAVLCQYIEEGRRRAISQHPRQLDKLLEPELALCGGPSLGGAGSHLQLVARKSAVKI